jgi:hypothetical protein
MADISSHIWAEAYCEHLTRVLMMSCKYDSIDISNQRVAVIMEAAGTSEISSTFARLHGAVFKETVIFII